VVKPTTGAPAYEEGAASASYLGTRYQLLHSYQAETTYVAGEFYWPVERGQKSWNRDFASGAGLLSMERTPREVMWSSGSKIASDAVAKAFGLDGSKELLQRRDAGPVSSAGSVGCGTIVVLVIVLLLFLFLIRACANSAPGGGGAWRSGGGSYGGYSSGGGHK
jgi:hypothetical protein